MRYTKNIPSFIDILLRPMLASIACAGTALGAYKLFSVHIGIKLGCLGAILVAAMVYIAALLLLRAVREEDIRLLPKGDRVYALLHKCHLL